MVRNLTQRSPKWGADTPGGVQRSSLGRKECSKLIFLFPFNPKRGGRRISFYQYLWTHADVHIWFLCQMLLRERLGWQPGLFLCCLHFEEFSLHWRPVQQISRLEYSPTDFSPSGRRV